MTKKTAIVQFVIQALQAKSRDLDAPPSVEDGFDLQGEAHADHYKRPNAKNIYKRFIQAFTTAILLSAKLGAAAQSESSQAPGLKYTENLTLKPLPAGRMSILFEFDIERPSPRQPSQHMRLASPQIILPLQHSNVSEMHLSLVTGRWRANEWGQPQHPEWSGTGAELRAWFKDEE